MENGVEMEDVVDVGKEKEEGNEEKEGRGEIVQTTWSVSAIVWKITTNENKENEDTKENGKTKETPRKQRNRPWQRQRAES